MKARWKFFGSKDKAGSQLEKLSEAGINAAAAPTAVSEAEPQISHSEAGVADAQSESIPDAIPPRIAYFEGPKIVYKNERFKGDPNIITMRYKQSFPQLKTSDIPTQKVDIAVLYGHGSVVDRNKKSMRGYSKERAVIDLFVDVSDTANAALEVQKKMHPKVFSIMGCYEGAVRESLEAAASQFQPGTVFIIPASSKHMTAMGMANEFLDRLFEESQNPEFDALAFAAKESLINPESLLVMQVMPGISHSSGQYMDAVKFISPKDPEKCLQGVDLIERLRHYASSESVYNPKASKGHKPHQEAHMVIMSGNNNSPLVNKLRQERKIAALNLTQDVVDHYAERALRVAMGRGNTGRVRQWLAQGANVNGTDWNKQTVMDLCQSLLVTSEKKIEIAAILLESGAKFSHLNGALEERFLREIISLDRADIASLLFKDKSDYGRHYLSLDPLILAIKAKSKSSVTLFLRESTHLNNEIYGPSPLYLATDLGEQEIALGLIAQKGKVNLNFRENGKGMSVLENAIAGGHQAIALALIAQKDRIDLNGFSKYTQSPLELAIKSGDKEIVRALIADNHVGINLKDITQRAFIASVLLVSKDKGSASVEVPSEAEVKTLIEVFRDKKMTAAFKVEMSAANSLIDEVKEEQTLQRKL